MTETVKIGEWYVPKHLFDNYVRIQIMADGYLLGTLGVPSKMDHERAMRWQLCVEQVMILHRQICEAIGVEYSDSENDPFYLAFHKAVYEQTKLKG